ncbi:hypothetical protein QUB30_02525 [Microcoleus sp. BROC3]
MRHQTILDLRFEIGELEAEPPGMYSQAEPGNKAEWGMELDVDARRQQSQALN